MDVQQHAEKPHHGELGQVLMKLATGRRHPRPAIADALDAGTLPRQFSDQVRSVQVTAGLAYGKKEFHARPQAYTACERVCRRTDFNPFGQERNEFRSTKAQTQSRAA
jgi:hypothetical protein